MAFQDQGEFDATVRDQLEDVRTAEAETAADNGSRGACYLRSGGFSGCYPGMTYAECRSVAHQLDISFEWQEGGECQEP